MDLRSVLSVAKANSDGTHALSGYGAVYIEPDHITACTLETGVYIPYPFGVTVAVDAGALEKSVKALGDPVTFKVLADGKKGPLLELKAAAKATLRPYTGQAPFFPELPDTSAWVTVPEATLRQIQEIGKLVETKGGTNQEVRCLRIGRDYVAGFNSFRGVYWEIPEGGDDFHASPSDDDIGVSPVVFEKLSGEVQCTVTPDNHFWVKDEEGQIRYSRLLVSSNEAFIPGLKATVDNARAKAKVWYHFEVADLMGVVSQAYSVLPPEQALKLTFEGTQLQVEGVIRQELGADVEGYQATCNITAADTAAKRDRQVALVNVSFLRDLVKTVGSLHEQVQIGVGGSHDPLVVAFREDGHGVFGVCPQYPPGLV